MGIMKIKTIVTAFAAIGIWAAPALASDDIVEQRMGDWSGGYLGVHAGYGWSDIFIGPGSLTPPGTPGTTIDGDGYLIGLLAGYNMQNGDMVYGVEADVSFGSIEAIHPTPTLPSVEIDFMASVRARAGIVNNGTYFFATAGIAFAEAEGIEIGNAGTGSSESHTGVVAGIGFDHKLEEDVLVRIEYLHSWFDDETYGPFSAAAPHFHAIEFDTDVVRAALIKRY